MNDMNHDHMPPPTANGGMGNSDAHPHHHRMMMHMTFFWSKNAEILFAGWPGTDPGMYALALAFVFFLSLLVEWLSRCNLIRSDGSNHVAAGLIQTLVHAVRIALAYMVMLAVMSFNAGVFVAAVFGHALGFLLFGSRIFKKTPPPSEKTTDGPPMMSC